MTTDPRIEAAARALYKQEASESGSPDPWPSWEGEGNAAREIFRDHATAAVAAIDKAATITTVEELDALPEESVIHSEQGGVWERCDDGEVRYWITTGNSDEVFNSSQITLPARVIHWGTE